VDFTDRDVAQERLNVSVSRNCVAFSCIVSTAVYVAHVWCNPIPSYLGSCSVQSGSGAHPASCTMGTGGPFPRTKARPWCDADHSPPSSAEVENE
jgi:hypothetical protein